MGSTHAPEQDDASRALLQHALGGAYQIERELGRGGMATVYLAHDQKHDRPVALKVLRPDLGAALGPERFQREIRLAARLQHPHILPVFDSGDADGRLWYTMPYVEGETLRGRLARERQLPIDDAVSIVREAAQGLHYAHQHHVIHRDVKPENILLTEDGSTLVADFGIARAIAGDTGTGLGGTTRLTGTGLAIGTPAYMSPEQAAGEHDIDARSDVYSLGAVLYELLAGEPPFTGATPQAILAKRFATAAPSVRVVRPGVPLELGAVLARALATAPADRFSSAGEFSAALAASVGAMSREGATGSGAPAPRVRWRRWSVLAAGTAGIVLIGVGAWVMRGRSAATGPSGERGVSLAVLPFENLGDSADAYFADGITDEVRGKLASLHQLRVIASTSSREYRRSRKQPSEIARELGVRYLLVGRVRWQKRAGAPIRVRVDPELIDVTGGPAPETRWQQPFDAELSDVFQVQSEIAQRVARELPVVLATNEMGALQRVPTRSLDAYDAFLRGQQLIARGRFDPTMLRRASAAFREAVTRDSTFVRAWVALANTYTSISCCGGGSRVYGLDSARIALTRARTLEASHPEVQAADARYEGMILYDWERARAIGAEGVTRSPNDAALLAIVGRAEWQLGRWESGAAHLRRAFSLDPRSADLARTLGYTKLCLTRVADARRLLDFAIALEPALPAARTVRAIVELSVGDSLAARAVLRGYPPTEDRDPLVLQAYREDVAWLLDDSDQRRLLSFGPSAWGGHRGFWAMMLSDMYALRGDSSRARAYADSARSSFERMVAEDPNNYEPIATLGFVYAYAGQTRDAIRAADRALELVRAQKYPGWLRDVRDWRARIFLVLGERARALDELEAMQGIPSPLTPAYLKIHPSFAALRNEPRFKVLTAAR